MKKKTSTVQKTKKVTRRKHTSPSPQPVHAEYPMRINKYLAHKGIATRTGADQMIVESKVTINGVQAKLGDKVTESDIVEIRGKHNKKNFVYFAYNKPRGVVSTNPQGDEIGIMQNIQLGVKVFPIGRLDKESHGLMILTNDGRVTDRLLNPIYNHEKEYFVEIDRKITPAFLKHMSDGVTLSDYTTKTTKTKQMSETTFSIVLSEGKNRQIRRMTEVLGYTVRDLKRVRVQNIELGNLASNTAREITAKEKESFLTSIGLV